MNKYLHNLSGVTKIYVGIEILNNDYHLIPPLQELKYMEDDLLLADIALGDTLMSRDGVVDLGIAQSLIFLAWNTEAFDVRFRAEPERANLFVSTNVQEAIEEAKATLQGKISVLPTFLNNGNTSNKWLELDGSFPSSDNVPAVINFDSAFAALTYMNINDGSNLDIEFYKNGMDPADLVYTWEIRNARYAYKTNALTGVTWARGDTMGCFAKRVTPGTGASTVLVTVLVQSINSDIAEQQFPTLP